MRVGHEPDDHWTFQCRGSAQSIEFGNLPLPLFFHQWIEAVFDNPIDPTLVIKPWADKFGTRNPK